MWGAKPASEGVEYDPREQMNPNETWTDGGSLPRTPLHQEGLNRDHRESSLTGLLDLAPPRRTFLRQVKQRPKALQRRHQCLAKGLTDVLVQSL